MTDCLSIVKIVYDLSTFYYVLESIREEEAEGEKGGGDTAEEDDRLEDLEGAATRSFTGGECHEGEGEGGQPEILRAEGRGEGGDDRQGGEPHPEHPQQERDEADVVKDTEEEVEHHQELQPGLVGGGDRVLVGHPLPVAVVVTVSPGNHPTSA